MVLWTWVQQHRVLSILALAVVVVACAGGTAWALVFRTVSSPVTLREALRVYRKEQGARFLGLLRTHLPAPGVYTYRTEGDEGLSLAGVGRSFPQSTSMVVADGACVTVSWVPLAQHTEVTVMCRADGGLRVSRLVTDEEIAGSSTRSVVTCPPTAYLLPPPADAARGAQWHAMCTLSDPEERVALHGVDLGSGALTVGGRAVGVEHTRVTLTYSGPVSGTNPTDYWIEPSTGLVVRETETVAVAQGGVDYHERMAVDLVALTPAR